MTHGPGEKEGYCRCGEPFWIYGKNRCPVEIREVTLPRLESELKQAMGRLPTPREALDLARQFGWQATPTRAPTEGGHSDVKPS